MTTEEAIRLLDPETTGEAIAEIEYYNGFRGKTAAIQAITAACEIAVEAMNKQIPKKPVDFGNESYLCPNCRRNNFYDGTETLNKTNFCNYCGQAIDWSSKR